MDGITISQLIPVLQTAIGPVILISGVGLLLLTMTNRLGRTIDRARALASEAVDAGVESRERIQAQLTILWKRARLIRSAITLASASALCAALLIIALFLTALFSLDDVWLISALFIACLSLLIGSLVVFIHDINQSLNALKLELQAHIHSES
jgi:flagellar biosynthesis regulator FlaF